MKKIVLIWLIFLFSIAIAVAQNNLPPIYEIKNDTASEFYLDTAYYHILEDKEGKLTFNQITQPSLINHFHSKGIKTKDVDTSSTIFWFRFRLKDVTNKEIKIALPALGNETHFYIVQGTNQPKDQKTGDLIPESKRDGYKRINAIPVTLMAGEEVLVYSRVRNFFPLNFLQDFKISVYTQKFIDQEYIVKGDEYVPFSTIRDSFFGAILVIGAILNFLFFLINRERVYLFFASFLLCLFVPVFPLREIIARENFVLYSYLSDLWIFWPFFFFQFMRYYLQTYRFLPRWDKLILFISVLGLLSLSARTLSLYFNFNFNTPFNLPLTYFTISSICYFITPFLLYKNNRQSARLFMIASLPFSVSMIMLMCMYSLVDFGLFISDSWTNSVIISCLISCGWLVIFFLWILFKRYDRQKKEIAKQALQAERFTKEREIERRQLIEKQKIELEKTVEERTAELKQSFQELKSTQAQLIQSEKMASLGELTAGIAHEIQNPLNFVNNFSDVNSELIDEATQEIDKGNHNEVKAILSDIKENEEKINHHGKRADAIVKGMLQHSRSSSGQKEPTDINALTDEYLRLSYHGMKAKDKNFNAEIKTDFDGSIGKINIIPQDIGRVILNLINNAFYAVSEKKKQAGDGYEPTVIVTTKLIIPSVGGRSVQIKVADNGGGIPQKILDKIFQPFFTTKPTGQGTGLGLSLSYDIIKAHGGDIKVETLSAEAATQAGREGEGTEFIVQLPLS